MATLNSNQPETVPTDWTVGGASEADRAAVDDFASRHQAIMADLRSCPEPVREAATAALVAVQTEITRLQRWAEPVPDTTSQSVTTRLNALLDDLWSHDFEGLTQSEGDL